MNSPTEVSLLRLYLIRALFLIMCVGTVLTQVPGMLHRDPPWSLMHGVGASMLLAMAVLSAVGVRYPLQMLPILLWELFWKSIWLLVFALPLWRANRMDAETLEVGQGVPDGSGTVSAGDAVAVRVESLCAGGRRSVALDRADGPTARVTIDGGVVDHLSLGRLRATGTFL